MANDAGAVLWFTGLPCSGKSTLAEFVALELKRRGCDVEILDGDLIRRHLGPDLGFSKEDRDENVRRVGFVCHLLARHGTIALAALVSPYRAARQEVRAQGGQFVEVYVKASPTTCRRRDVKGMYKRAARGEIRNFTGVDDPYEPPLDAEIEVDTETEGPVGSAAQIIVRLEQLGVIASQPALAAS
ncbi:MAG: adenylyl-sulfate kinase [Terriglobia bacterium]